jgi:hypothetical protein
VTDEEDAAAAGGQGRRVEATAAQLDRDLRLDPERSAGETRRLGRP